MMEDTEDMEVMKRKEEETREFWKAFKELPAEQAKIFELAVIGRAAYNKLEKYYGKAVMAEA